MVDITYATSASGSPRKMRAPGILVSMSITSDFPTPHGPWKERPVALVVDGSALSCDFITRRASGCSQTTLSSSLLSSTVSNLAHPHADHRLNSPQNPDAGCVHD